MEKSKEKTVVPFPESQKKQRSVFILPDFDRISDTLVEEHINSMLPKAELEAISDETYEDLIEQSLINGELAARRELEETAMNYSKLSACDPALPPPSYQPASTLEKYMSNLLLNSKYSDQED